MAEHELKVGGRSAVLLASSEGEGKDGEKLSAGSFQSRSQTYALLKQQLAVAAKFEDFKEAARIGRYGCELEVFDAASAGSSAMQSVTGAGAGGRSKTKTKLVGGRRRSSVAARFDGRIVGFTRADRSESGG